MYLIWLRRKIKELRILINGILSTSAFNFQGTLSCSADPNYPEAEKGDVYLIDEAGKIGGASGEVVEVGDTVFCIADNDGGTQTEVGSSFIVVQANIDLKEYREDFVFPNIPSTELMAINSFVPSTNVELMQIISINAATYTPGTIELTGMEISTPEAPFSNILLNYSEEKPIYTNPSSVTITGSEFNDGTYDVHYWAASAWSLELTVSDLPNPDDFSGTLSFTQNVIDEEAHIQVANTAENITALNENATFRIIGSESNDGTYTQTSYDSEGENIKIYTGDSFTDETTPCGSIYERYSTWSYLTVLNTAENLNKLEEIGANTNISLAGSFLITGSDTNDDTYKLYSYEEDGESIKVNIHQSSPDTLNGDETCGSIYSVEVINDKVVNHNLNSAMLDILVYNHDTNVWYYRVNYQVVETDNNTITLSSEIASSITDNISIYIKRLN